jgi:lactoylglutathione lyase
MSADPGRSGPSAPLITGFFHGGIAVSDMERSLAFYRDALGLEVHFDVTLDAVAYVREVLGIEMRDARLVYLRVPGSDGVFVELIEYHGTDGRPVVPRAWDPGTGHLCFHVADAAALHARVVSMGFPPRSPGVATIPIGPNRGGRAAYLLDPDGHHVEIFQRPAPAGDPSDEPDGGTDVPTR